MTTPLMRSDLLPLYCDVCDAQDAHPGLLLQRGLTTHIDSDHEIKANHIDRVCSSSAGDFYCRAYTRWLRATATQPDFRSVTLKVETRLFSGLGGGGMLETGCTIGHSHGVPYIPGSSIKGVVNAHARERFDTEDGAAICNELFGAPATEHRRTGGSGLITFHDAWWVPNSAERPLVREVVTTHHQDYYSSDGCKPATDFDSPIPSPQVAVRGEFLFVIAAPVGWLELSEQMLIAALSTRGAGAKTRAGYGLFSEAETRCEWVYATITTLMTQNNAQRENILRSKALAEAWSQLEDPAVKEAAYNDIRARWQEQGWWEERPSGKSARAAKEIYDEYSPR